MNVFKDNVFVNSLSGNSGVETNIAKILSEIGSFVSKHELDEGSCLETYFQSDHVYIEGANELLPEILKLFLKNEQN